MMDTNLKLIPNYDIQGHNRDHNGSEVLWFFDVKIILSSTKKVRRMESLTGIKSYLKHIRKI